MATIAADAVLLARDLELPHVSAAIGACLDYSAAWTIEDAAAAGYKFLVQQLAMMRQATPTQPATNDSLVMDFAARNGHLEILQWLHSHETLGRCSTRSMDDAAKNGHLAIVQWLHDHRSEGCTVKAMDYAAKSGHLDIVQWLHVHRAEGCTKKAMDLAAKQGHLHVLQWLDAHREEGCTNLAVEHASNEGHVHVLRWLCEHRKMTPTATAMVKAARFNRLSVLEYVRERFQHDFEQVGAKMVHAAIANGHVDLMTWLIAVLPVRALKCEEGGATYSWMDVAAEYGQVGILRWFSEHATELPVGVQVDGHLQSCTAEAIEKAAGNGHIAVLDFLRNHDMVELESEEDAVKALTAAVHGGHRQCVDWLLRNFSEHYSNTSASTSTMDTAAASGHVQILRYLRENPNTSTWRTSAKAVNEAARQGFVHVLQWLMINEVDDDNDAPESQRWTPRALEIASANGHFHVVQWIVTHRCAPCRSAEALNAAAYMDHLEIAQFLYSHIRSSCSIPQAVEHAEEGGAEETLEWLESLSPQDRR